MAIQQHIRNPIEWGWDSLKQTGRAMGSAGETMEGAWEGHDRSVPRVRRITAADLRDVLRQGFDDFGAYRTDVIFLCLLYPIVGLVLSRLIWGYGMVPLLFPLASGFALIAPFFAVGLYEMSRRREAGRAEGWADAFGVARSPALGSIMALGLLLLALFVLWLGAAHIIWLMTLGPEPPISLQAFAQDVVGTSAGRTMAIVGLAVGFVFALAVLMLSVVSFPLLLDRDVGLGTAIATSVEVVRENPGPMALWGLIIAAALALGSIPLLLGLAIVFPVLGHATWHLYRKVLPR
ncbi:MAG: DUF2189 domain-containing protein [Alphaproteobacteria bacterium]|nr:MAG: DUF2189 domain-containing protein [Alphaproteobacteria bacterium]